MSAPLITTKNLYLQKEFSEQTEAWLRLAYGVAEDEELSCAVWVSPWARRGFLVTDEAVRWSVAGNDGAKANGALLKDVNPAADFTITPAVSDANAAQASKAKTAAEELSRLEITADGKTFTFFVKGLTAEKGKTLCDILHFGYTQGEVPQTDLSTFVKPMPFLAVRNFLDGDLVFFSSVADKILGIAKAKKQSADKETSVEADKAREASNATPDAAAEKADGADAMDAQTESAQQTATTAEAESVAPPQTSFGDCVRNALLAVLDVCASLVFVATVVIILKPSLLQRFINLTKIVEQSADTFLNRDSTIFWHLGDFIKLVKDNYDAQLSNVQHGVVGIGLMLFFLLKIIVLLGTKHNKQKIVSFLVVIISLFAVFLVVDRFALFIPFCLLAYLAFQYSCGLRTTAIIIKLVILLILAYIGYVTAHIVLIPENTSAFKQIFENLTAICNTFSVKIKWL